eukprot:Lithocolla_globosa_v1_NODE_814_length_3238_cov_52.363179.p4 type:complete len:108 gc:universal NODE_814_length_3238_cov_52.363179:2531-2208(-)
MVFRQYVRIWVVKCSDLANALPQVSHLKGFLPVCMRIWMIKCSDLANALPQVSQLKGFSPVCVRICLVKSVSFLNFFSQVSQVNFPDSLIFSLYSLSFSKHILQVFL